MGIEEEAKTAFVEIEGESVSDEAVFAFADSWPGEMASGTPPMPREWVEQWLARINGRREWPGRWQRCLVAQWRADWRGYVPKVGIGNGKNAPGLSANVEAIASQKKIAALAEEEDALTYELNALAQANIEPPAEKVARLKAVRALLLSKMV